MSNSIPTESQGSYSASVALELTSTADKEGHEEDTQPVDASALKFSLGGGFKASGQAFKIGDKAVPWELTTSLSFNPTLIFGHIRDVAYQEKLDAAKAAGEDTSTIEMAGAFDTTTYKANAGFNLGLFRLIDFTATSAVLGQGKGSYGIGLLGLTKEWEVDDGRVFELVWDANPTDWMLRGGFGHVFGPEIYTGASGMKSEQGMMACYAYLGGSVSVPAPWDKKNPVYDESSFFGDGVPRDFVGAGGVFFPLSIPSDAEVADEVINETNRISQAAKNLASGLDQLEQLATTAATALSNDVVTNDLLGDSTKATSIRGLVEKAKTKIVELNKLLEDAKMAKAANAVDLAQSKVKKAKEEVLPEIIKSAEAATGVFRQIIKIAKVSGQVDLAKQMEQLLVKEDDGIDDLVSAAIVTSKDSRHPINHVLGVTVEAAANDVGISDIPGDEAGHPEKKLAIHLRYSTARSGYWAYKQENYSSWLHEVNLGFELTRSEEVASHIPDPLGDNWNLDRTLSTNWQLSAEVLAGAPSFPLFANGVFKGSKLTLDSFFKATLAGQSTTEASIRYDTSSDWIPRDPGNPSITESVPFSFIWGVKGKWGGKTEKKYAR